LSKNNLEHIAFILDGNKRWSKINNISLKNSYKEGLKNINNIIKYCLELKVSYLTLFTLSSENIKRNTVGNIFQVIYDDFAYFFDKIIDEKKVRIKIIGSKKHLPKKIIDLIKSCEENTKNNLGLNLNLAFNYGFKNEIKEVLIKYLEFNKKINVQKDADIKKLFLLGEIPDPDILIRSGGEKRLSNFIMYNLTYTEIFFIDTLWPDFSKKELLGIINNYKTIKRRYGL
jgi:undecaprenyl diphosphate synthase